MTFPEWTEAQTDNQDAIQFLRLNELRDSINELIFPYLITITPYFRMASWLTWIYTKLEKDLAEGSMTTRDYINKSLKYYGVLAVADILFSQATNATNHRGPIGVQTLERHLAQLDGDTVDFNHPYFGKPLNPTPIYRSSLIAMGLLEEKLQPLPQGRYQSILRPTENGKKLADTFEKSWSSTIDPDNVSKQTIWKKTELQKLGELIALQGLKPNDNESKLLQKSAQGALRQYPEMYEEFVTLVIDTVTKCSQSGYQASASDVSKAALYRCIPNSDNKILSIKLADSQAISLLAYHELHTHLSFGADAILDALVNLSKTRVGGISKQTIINNASKASQIDSNQKLADLYQTTKQSFKPIKSQYQIGYPIPFGPSGFESTRNKMVLTSDYNERIGYGAVILLQSAACQDLFKPEWLLRILPFHRKVFSAYSVLEEYQSLSKQATIRDWIEAIVDLVIEKQ